MAAPLHPSAFVTPGGAIKGDFAVADARLFSLRKDRLLFLASNSLPFSRQRISVRVRAEVNS